MISRTEKPLRLTVAILTAAVLVGLPLTRAIAASSTPTFSVWLDCDAPDGTQGEALIHNTPGAGNCTARVLPQATGTITFTATAGTFTGANPCTLSGTPSRCGIVYNTPTQLGADRITASWSGGAAVGEEVSSVTSICPPTCGTNGGGGGSGPTNNSTTTTLSCGAATQGLPDSCTATVADVGVGSFIKSPPTGTVSFSGGTGSFSASSCTLGSPDTTTNSSSCPVNFTPSATGGMTLTASYGGGPQWNPSVGTASLTVQPAAGTPGAFKPDGMIRRLVKGTTFNGNNIYNGTGNHQTARAIAGRGEHRSFQVQVQNDGNAKDQFFVSVPGQRPPGFHLQYFVGTKDITAQVANHTYKTVVLVPGATTTFRVVVTVLAHAPLGTVRAWYIDIRSVGNPNQRDVVKFKLFTPKA